MISVIMPTLWRAKHYKSMLPKFNAHPLVGEIIIIDNDPINADIDVIKFSKVVYAPQEKNLYVNPSWNLGVLLAKYDKLCFYSDDCLINTSSIDAVYQHINEQNGMIGYHLDSINSDEGFDVLDFPFLDCEYENVIEPMPRLSYSFAICFYMHKNSYHKIPENLKIFYGDKYLFEQSVKSGKNNLAISNALVLTTLHTSSHSDDLKDIVMNDHSQKSMDKNSKISVVIPTMWKPIEYMRKMLPLLEAHPLIGEILLVDNDSRKTDHELLKNISKLNYWSFEEHNIYVNPAWNFGAKNAKYDKLFILNDDCLVNLDPIETIFDNITPERGMVGFSYLSYCTYTTEAFETLRGSGFGTEISIEIIDPRNYPTRSGMPHPFYGSAYFIHRDSYHVIPDDFRIHYGDLFIYVSNLKKGIGNYVIDDGLVMTQYSSTVSTAGVRDILLHEASILKEVFAKYDLKNIKYEINIVPEK